MTDGSVHFVTAIAETSGVWPGPPATWSYSSLKDADECPRRWMLKRATYQGLWAGRGYPPNLSVPALVGSVVHGSLERIIRAVQNRGGEEPPATRVVAVLRELGGFSAVVDDQIEFHVAQLRDNPRVSPVLFAIESSVRARIPEMRQRVQAILARTVIVRSGESATRQAGAGIRGALGMGSHSEVDLRSERLRFAGRVDLITISESATTITDYKTGARDERHADQIRTYALLWGEDRTANPRSLPASQLIVMYEDSTWLVEPPTPEEQEESAQLLSRRIRTVERDLERRPPEARPSPESCRSCEVRHLCEAYWTAASAADSEATQVNQSFADCELVVKTRRGPKSWAVEMMPGGTDAILRVASEKTHFGTGERIRVLGVVLARDEESGVVTCTATRFSETYVMDRQPDQTCQMS